MKTQIRYLLRTAVTAVALLGLSVSGLAAKQMPIRGWFHDTWLAETIIDPLVGFVGLNIDLGGTGWVSPMLLSVSFLCNDQTNNMSTTTMKRPGGLPDLMPFTGDGTYTLRESSGASPILRARAAMDPVPKNGHAVSFGGTFEIMGGTGRFAAATGSGTWTGWVDFDDLVTQSSGPGFWEFAGTLILPDKPHCRAN